MNTIVMFGWLPAVFYIFTRIPAQRAIVFSFITAWLFLPLAEFKLVGIPEYTKMSATCYSVLLATFVYDFGRFNSFKFSWLDVPMAVWCFCPFISALTNDLGPYEGFSSTFSQVVVWGVPYFIGRIYLNNFLGLRQLSIGIFLGGLAYIPFCLFEIVTHKSLHQIVYRFSVLGQTAAFAIRYGGYRPSVFMPIGLMLAVWMMAATVLGVVLWKTGIIKRVWHIPVGWTVGILMVTFVLVRSTGAYFLLVLGLAMLYLAKQSRSNLLLWILLGFMFIYLYLGAVGAFPGQQIIDFLGQFMEPDRLQSLGFRFMNEEILSAKARERMLFGWGGFGRNQIFNAQGYLVTTTDSLWIIALGVNGLVGLVSLFTALVLPALSFWFFYPPTTWSNANIAVAAALAVVLLMYALDCVLNAMVNPIFALAGGGLAGVVVSSQRQNVAFKT